MARDLTRIGETLPVCGRSALKDTPKSRMWESRLSGSERGVGGNRCYRPPMVELGTHSVTERAEVGNSPPTGLCILGAPRLLDRMIAGLQPTIRAKGFAKFPA